MSQNRVKDLINQAINIPIWQANKGIGSFITFDMGERIILRRKNGSFFYRGSVHLWVYLCDWIITLHGETLAKSNDSEIDITNAIKNFEGQQLYSINKLNSNTLIFKV